jgi:ABC-2 type transport system permease protein
MTSLPVILRIARKEFTELVRDGRFRVIGAAVVLLSLLSLAAGWKSYVDLSRQHDAARAATRQQWLSQDRKNPHSAAHYGMYAFKPKSQLAMVDTGVDPYVGVAVWLEAHKQNDFKFRPAQDRTAVQRFGDLTGAEVLQVLLPLFIVLMTFAAFAGEREDGTLRQLLSLGVRARDLAAGKAAGVAAALAIVLLPATLFAIAAFSLSDDTGLLAADPARALLLAAAYLAYFAVTVAIALGVSARVRSSRIALVVLLTFWFANSLVAPRLIGDVAASIHPTPSAIRFQKALDADLNDAEEMKRRLDRRRAELFTRYQVDNVDALPIAFSGVSLQEGEVHGNEVFDKHYGALFDRYERQDRVAQLAGLFAPMLAMRSLSMGLSGTDFQQHRDFTLAAEQYRRDIQRVMNDDIMMNQKKGTVYLADRSLWSQVAEFEYRARPASWVLRNHVISTVVLGVWLLGAVAFVVRSAGAARPQ